jgi:L-lactate dehydrogenase complex protein LldG
MTAAPGDARDQILARIRAAAGPEAGAYGRAGPAGPQAGGNGDAGPGAQADQAYAALPRGYMLAHHDPARCDIVDLFAERCADYRAVVERVPRALLASVVARVLAERRAERPVPFVVPDGLPAEWLAAVPADVQLATDTPPLSAAELDTMAGVVTGCAVAIAETGTIILDHGLGQGRRALTLVPDFHLAVVLAAQVAADLADGFARLDPARPHTLISGPSATSDIELIRVEGVHGPRQLHVLVVGPETGAGL